MLGVGIDWAEQFHLVALGRPEAGVFEVTRVEHAAEHFNKALRTFYFGLAALSWFLQPYLFMALTALVVVVVYRREFHSHTLVILGASRRADPGRLNSVLGLQPLLHGLAVGDQRREALGRGPLELGLERQVEHVGEEGVGHGIDRGQLLAHQEWPIAEDNRPRAARSCRAMA